MNNSLTNRDRKNDLILQMDVEGSEWNVLNQTLTISSRTSELWLSNFIIWMK